MVSCMFASIFKKLQVIIKMKLQKVIFYFPNFSEGGVENTSIKLSNYFTKNKIKIHFVSFKPPNKKYFKNNNLYKKNGKVISDNNSLLKDCYKLYKIIKSQSII